MTTTVGSGTWSFGGTNLSNLGVVMVETIDGLTSMPPLKGSNVVLASIPGEQWQTKHHGARQFSLGLLVVPVSGQTDPNMSMYGNLDALAQVFGVDTGEQALVHTRPDGSVRTANAQVIKYNPARQTPQRGVYFRAVVEFLLTDPWFYGTQVAPVNSIATSTPFNISNTGTVRTHKVLLDVLGPATNPRVTNNTNGWWVECDVTVATGQHLLIDCTAFTATNNAVNAIGSVQHSGGFPFMEFEPGTNQLAVTGGSTGATLTCTFQPAFF